MESETQPFYIARYKDRNGVPIEHRYDVVKFIGEGVFANVYEVKKKETSQRFALKVAKVETDIVRYTRMEIDILVRLAQAPPEYASLFARLLEVFIQGQQPCLLFHLYGQNLYEFLRDNGFRALPVAQVRKASHQMIKALDYLHNSLNVIHADLKAENILLVKSPLIEKTDIYGGKYFEMADINIKIADFNSVAECHENTYQTGLVQTPFYRAPEVLLDLRWNHKIDMFSLGCIIIDMFTGSSIFLVDDADLTTDESLHKQLSNICTYCGPVPLHMIKASPNAYLRHNETIDLSSQTREIDPMSPEQFAAKDIRILIRNLMIIDPDVRWSSKQALELRSLYEM